jgi:hypothetical protein
MLAIADPGDLISADMTACLQQAACLKARNAI